MPAGCARRQMTTLICSELKDQRPTSGPNCWLRRGTGRASQQRIACAIFIETAGRVASCHAEMPTAVRGSRELVGPMSARNGNQVANHSAYRSRAHSAPKWMTEQLRAAAYVEVNLLKPGSAETSGKGPEVVAGHFYSTKPAAAPLVGRWRDRSCCTLCGLTGDCKTFISAIQRPSGRAPANARSIAATLTATGGAQNASAKR